VTVQRASSSAPSRTVLATLAGRDYALDYRPMLAARSPFVHLPALDGLRGLAIIAVLLFHAGWRLTSGGFLAVSTFFTLSGYLITARLLHDHRQSGRVDLLAFWGRRVRRLVPAAVGAVALVVVLAASVVPAFRVNLIGDVGAALGEVANWRFWAVGRSYSALFRQPSPLLHFWSLAIEEQFYVVFPILAWFVLVVARRTQRTFAKVVAALTAVCVVAAVWAGATGRTALAYYGTPMRAGEILIGSLLAMGRLGRPSNARTGPVARLLPAYALAACLVLWIAATTTQGWLYHGGLAAYALLSATVVAGCVRPGPVRRWLSFRPLRWLGRISYGVYLYHWPLYQWLSPSRTRLAAGPLFVLRVTASIAAAVLSYHLLEQPILRRARFGWGRARRFAIPLLATMGSIVLAAIVIAGGHQQSTAASFGGLVAPARATSLLESTTAATVVSDTVVPPAPSVAVEPVTTATTATAPAPADPAVVAVVTTPSTPAPTTTPTTAAPAATRISMFGDSTAMLAAYGLDIWSRENGQAVVDGSGARLGCGIGRGGRVRIAQYGEGPTNPECDAWPTRWPAVLAKRPADVAVIMVGPWDVTDRVIPGDDQWRAPGDPTYDAYLKSEMEAAVDLLTSQVPTVVWLTNPLLDFGRADAVPPATPYPVSEPARTARYNEILQEIAAERPALHLVDLAGWMRTLPGGELDASIRPDGVHFSKSGAVEVARWLGPELLALLGRQAPTSAG
jgi:peptidoglycan/LPS O-acetylase OafA/YrhL/lysophospholipase L1-like esterase